MFARAYVLIITFMLTLVGCVNYYGMQSQATLMQPNDLHTNTANNKNRIAWPQDHWWTKFHDPQLNNLEQQAIANSPNLKIAQARLLAAAQLVNQADATRYPSLNTSGSIVPQRFTQTGIYPPGFLPSYFTQTNLALNFQYEFDFWGKNRETLAAALSEAQATAADVAQAQLILTTAVAQTYFQIQADQARIDNAQDLLKQNAQVFNLTRLQRQQGLATDLNISQTKSNVETAKINLENLRQTLAIDQHQLAALLGKNPETFIATRKTTNKTALSLPAVLPANLIARRPDVMALRLRAEEAAHNVKVAKAQFFPDINLAASIGFETITLSKLFQHTSLMNSIGPAISLPIFDAGALRANLGTKYANYDIAAEQYNQQVITAMQQVADQVSITKSIERQLVAQRTNLKATQNIYNLTNLRYRNGLDDALNVAQTKIPYLTQRDAQIQLNLQQQQAIINLIKALGGGY